MYSTTDRSWVMNRQEKPRSRCRSVIRLRIEACTLTSSADTGSSAMTRLGSTRQRPGQPDALALPAGQLVRVAVAQLGAQAALLEHLVDARGRGPRPAPCGAGASARRRSGRSSCAGSARSTGPGRRCARRGAAGASPVATASEISVPSSLMLPEVGSTSRVTQRPTVDLPLPDSPTRPMISPGPMVKRDAVDGLDRAGAAAEAAGGREVLDEVGRPRGPARRCACRSSRVLPGVEAGDRVARAARARAVAAG